MHRAAKRSVPRSIGLVAALFLCLAIASGDSELRVTPGREGTNDGAARLGPDRIEQRRWARMVLAGAEETAGPDSLEAADAMDRLAQVLATSALPGDLPEARNLMRRAIAVREALLPPDDPLIAGALADEVDVFWRFGRFEEARPAAVRALALRRRAAEPGDPGLATSLYQLASLLRIEGNYAAATPLYHEALGTWQEASGDHRRDIASALHYLGLMAWTLGDADEAGRLIDRSLTILGQVLGPEHPLLAQRLNLLGGVALTMGEPERAQALYERALRIWTRAGEAEHPDVARALVSLGRLRLDRGDVDTASRFFERALAIRTEVFGPEHPLVANSLADLGRTASARGDLPEAQRLLERAIALLGPDSASPDSELAPALVALARVEAARGDPAAGLEHALRAERETRQVFWKGARGLADAEALRYASKRAGGLGAAIGILLDERSPSEAAVASVFDEVIRSRGLALEAVSRAARSEPEAGAGVAEFREAMPRDTALIAYVRYEVPRGPLRDPDRSYAAFILDGSAGALRIVSLGPARTIDAAVRAWRADAGREPRLRAGRDGERACREAGERLRRVIWDPLAIGMAGASRVLLVPDGAVGLVSLGALPSARGGYLMESSPRIHYLAAERDLMETARTRATGQGVLVMGDAAFGEIDPGATAGFEPLPGTGREAAEVASMLRRSDDVTLLTGHDATEAAFRRLAPGRRILHLATHGYFLGEGERGRDPSLLSGLVMAGANRWQAAAVDGDDGILTAREIAGLDLSSVELAVLSGCDTGLGRVVDGEGVLGIRRAFRIAGARNLIVSLWRADDGAARAWMRQLYEGRQRGMPTDQAAEEASLALLREQRARGASAHPYFWGGFVAVGN